MSELEQKEIDKRSEVINALYGLISELKSNRVRITNNNFNIHNQLTYLGDGDDGPKYMHSGEVSVGIRITYIDFLKQGKPVTEDGNIKNTPLSEIGLSKRLLKVMQSNGYETLEDVLKKYGEELMTMEGMTDFRYLQLDKLVRKTDGYIKYKSFVNSPYFKNCFK